MPTKAEKDAEIEAIYSDIRVVLLGKLMERVNVVYLEGDMKEMARIQKRVVSLVESIGPKVKAVGGVNSNTSEIISDIAAKHEIPVDEAAAMYAIQSLMEAYSQIVTDRNWHFDDEVKNQMVIDFHRAMVESLDFTKFGKE